MTAPPTCDAIASVTDGPTREGNELRWTVELSDGRAGVLAQLLPELARDDALRRRYVADIERTRALGAPSVAPIIALGPAPDPRAPDAAPPWRLRLAVPGVGLEAWLTARAPAPIDEAVELAARLADALAEVHGRGGIVRNLHPRRIALGADGAPWLTDLGLARTDILTTRTAASLVLEGSAYAAPELLARTAVDPRADLFGLGVIAWRALTGELPYGDGPAILRDEAPLPALDRVRADVPAFVDAAVRACLAWQPERRPRSARELAAMLRGERPVPGEEALARVACQACGAALRPALRLCLACGRAAVQFARSRDDEDFAIDLTKARDDAAFEHDLRGLLTAVAEGKVPRLAFLVGDSRWYSDHERKALLPVPARIAHGMTRRTARELARRFAEAGIAVKVRNVAANRRWLRIGRRAVAGGVLTMALSPLAFAAAVPLGVVALATGALAVLAGTAAWVGGKPPKGAPLIALREAPTALPASDALVARLASLLGRATPADVRELVGELAALVQRLSDRRAELVGDDAELAFATEPVAPLVALIARRVEALAALDRGLAELDEGALVRALALSEARDEPRSRREPLLAALDRLRELEDQRGAHLGQLLEAAALLRRSVELGLRVRDPAGDERRALTMARAALALPAADAEPG
jgi:hypothetical protein